MRCHYGATLLSVLLAFSSVGLGLGKAVRRQAGSADCQSLVDTYGAGSFRVAVEFGITDGCAAGKVKNEFECQVGSINHDDAAAACASVGARLCTVEEIQAGTTRGLGCSGLYDEGSYCWLSDDGSSCADGEAMASRCRHFSTGQHAADPGAGTAFCKPHVEMGSLACCSSGPVEVAANRGAGDLDAECEAIGCAYDCAQVFGCGWSTPHNSCAAGQKTAAREMLSGSCDHVDRTLVDLNPICRQFKCGAECAATVGGACGWSTTSNSCKPGKTTRQDEMFLGTCGDVERTAFDCKTLACGWDCATKSNGRCGWSGQLQECRPDRHTNKREFFEGSCSDESIRAAGGDPCDKHTCGKNCSDAPGCGWRSGSEGDADRAPVAGKCVSGAQTSPAELSAGDCPIPPPTTEEFCNTFVCGADCATVVPLCGWSTPKNKCVEGKAGVGGKVSKAELNMGNCTASTSCSRHPCGRLCETQSGCGWSSGRDMCVQGANTNDDERAAFCPGDSTTSTTATDTTVTVSTVTETTTTKTTVSDTTQTTTSKTFTITTTPKPTTITTTIPVVIEENGSVCTNYIPPTGSAWTDSDGDTCATYKANFWCAIVDGKGDYGPSWGASGDRFETYVDSTGLHAGLTCCDCGGGTVTVEAITEPPVEDCCVGNPECCGQPTNIFTCPASGEALTEFVEHGKAKGDISTLVGSRIKGNFDAEYCAQSCLDAPACVAFQYRKFNTRVSYCELLAKGSGHRADENFNWNMFDKIVSC